MAQPELDRLIINNLADLDAAAKYVIYELGAVVEASLGTLLEEFIREAEWTGKADSKYIWLAPREWRKQGDHVGSDFECRYLYAVRSKSTANYDFFQLTSLLGIGFANLGLRWARNDVKNKKQWKNAVGQQQDIIAELLALGFEYEQADATFFLPVCIEQKALAQAVYEESPALALTPFNRAFQTCVDARPHFDRLLAVIGSLDGPKIAAIEE
jgi:hypothetical protein